MSRFGRTLVTASDDIVQRWYEAWQESNDPGASPGEAAVKDHLPVQLRWIGEALQKGDEAPEPGEIWSVTERLDPEARVLQEVPIEEVVREYALLVATVRAWIDASSIEVGYHDVSYFDQAILQLVAESVRRYSVFRAERKAQERSEYLARLTHQMRTPLTTLAMQVRALERIEGKVPEAVLERLVRNVKRLRFLVDGVMRLERFKPEELPVSPLEVTPARLIEQILDDHEHEAAGKGLRLEAAVDRTLRMRVDPDLLVDALDNLVHNAIKYTDEGFVRVTVEADGDRVYFSVIDSGPGIPPERQAALEDAVEPGEGGGMGLGLSIVRRAVEAQEGEVGVQSVEGRGATFRISLPRVVTARRNRKERDND